MCEPESSYVVVGLAQRPARVSKPKHFWGSSFDPLLLSYRHGTRNTTSSVCFASSTGSVHHTCVREIVWARGGCRDRSELKEQNRTEMVRIGVFKVNDSLVLKAGTGRPACWPGTGAAARAGSGAVPGTAEPPGTPLEPPGIRRPLHPRRKITHSTSASKIRDNEPVLSFLRGSKFCIS